jgi:hypothetical protein
MALEATFRNLSASLDRLNDALNTLHVILGDKPLEQELALIDGLENALLDTLGELHGARKAALTARKNVGIQPNLDRARRALATCQTRFHRLEQQFSLNLISYEKLRELVRLREKNKEWRSWADSTRQAIEQCRPLLERNSKALADCWQELAERLGTVNLSVQTVGQQIKVPRSSLKPLEPEGVT